MTISVDPSSAAPLAAAGAGRFLEGTGRADVLLPNADEAAALTGEADPEAAARVLSAHAREVVVTLGAVGALWTDGREVVHAAAAATGPAADTTGAGDAFAAGFLAEWLAGAAPRAALTAGCSLAARAIGIARA
jgi:sugar/nucleoside kinase (ribokinase family)